MVAMKRKYREAMRAANWARDAWADDPADVLRWFDDNRLRQDRQQHEQPKNEPRKMENAK
jgi:hypothetical protein